MSSILASLDMSLDDIISKKKTSNPDARPAKNGGGAGGRGGRGGAGPVRNNRRNSRRSEPYARGGAKDEDFMDVEDDEPAGGKKNAGAKRRAVVVKPQQQTKGSKKGSSILSRLGKAPTAAPAGTKILVKNLKYDILEDDVRELFGTVGQVSKAEIVYDRSGRSKGIARVWFAKRADAEKTIKQFDGRTLDGQPMQITLDEDKNVRKGLFGTALDRDDQVKFKVNFGDKKDAGSRGGRGRRRGGRGGNDGGAKTADDLDNEMDSYMKDA